MFSYFQKILFTTLILNLAVPMTWASCGYASCPIDTHTQLKTEKGMIRLDYSFEYSDLDQPRMGRQPASVGEILGHHDEVSTLNQTQRFGFDLGLTSNLSVDVNIPFVHTEHTHIHNHMGSPELESWNFNGAGDITIQSRYAFLNPEKEAHPRFSAIVGGVLPTGRHHVANNEGDVADPGLQPGKEAFSLILGASSLQKFSVPTLSGLFAQMPLFFSSTYQWNGQGSENYKIGNVLIANAGLTYPLFPKVGVMTQINFRINRQDNAGDTNEEVEKTGGSYVYASPGIQLTMSDQLWSYFLVQYPLYQRVNEIQLTADTNFLMGISYRFSVL